MPIVWLLEIKFVPLPTLENVLASRPQACSIHKCLTF